MPASIVAHSSNMELIKNINRPLLLLGIRPYLRLRLLTTFIRSQNFHFHGVACLSIHLKRYAYIRTYMYGMYDDGRRCMCLSGKHENIQKHKCRISSCAVLYCCCRPSAQSSRPTLIIFNTKATENDLSSSWCWCSECESNNKWTQRRWKCRGREEKKQAKIKAYNEFVSRLLSHSSFSLFDRWRQH